VSATMFRMKMRRTGKSTDVVGWIAIGLLAAVTGELVFPGRQKAGGITVMLLVGAKGALLGRFLVGLVARHRSDAI
jgi:uncharacterized membrane protein YeaQ/YmgE (transglycosylase-associated protein family)